MSRDQTKATYCGTHRARTFDETLERIVEWLPVAGITRVADVTGLDTVGVPTFMVVRPNSRSLSVSQGKGLSADAARISGIMEAIEHHHAERITLPLRLCRAEEVAEFGLLSEVSALPAFPRLNGPLLPCSRLLWAPAIELIAGAERWLPYELVHLDMTVPLPEGSGFFPLTSNGLASGNTVTEATVHALLELVERDARTLFYLREEQGRAAARVDPATVDDETCRRLIDQIDAEGFMLAIWDVTSDLGIACFLAGLLDGHDNPFRRLPVAYGCGCHLDRSVALARAITEAAQSRLTNIAGSRDDTTAEALDQARSDESQARYRAELAATGTGCSFGAAPDRRFESFERDLEFILERLQASELREALVVDLSKAGWPVAVVRAVVPGLEPLYELPGYQPGPRGRRMLGLAE